MHTEAAESSLPTAVERHTALVSLLDERDNEDLKSFGDWLAKHNQCVRMEVVDILHLSSERNFSLPVFAYLPAEGLDVVAPEKRKALEAFPRVHFFRLFKHQSILDGEQAPAEALWYNLHYEKDRFRQPDCAERPFLGWVQEDSFARCKKWMLCVLEHARLVTDQRATEALLTVVDTTARRLAGRVHRSTSHALLPSALLARLGLARAIRQRCSRLRDRRRELDDASQKQRSRFKDEAYEEVQRTVGRRDTMARVCATPVVPRELHEAFLSITRFATRMEETSSNLARSIASQLLRAITMDAPTLAVIGPFSSGKTTLLNTILLGEKPGCAFATKTTANTAIVHLISQAIPPELESARMTYRSRIDACLFDRGNPECATLLDDINRKAILRLIQRGAVDESSLQLRLFLYERDLPKVWTGSKVLRWLKKNNNTAESPKISRIEFVATCKVDAPNFRELVREIRLHPEIQLGTEAEWREFRGEGQTSADAGSESVLASLLVEQVHIKLRADLLDLTRIADTPGIGSSKEHHDWVTESFLERADGFLVVLPGDTRIEHIYVRKIFDLLIKTLSPKGAISPREGLSQVAFLVNISQGALDEKAQRIAKDYQKMIADRFELSAAEFSRHVRFYIARLKGERPEDNGEEMYGYPSLAAFCRWFAKDLFAHASYRKRFTDAHSVLKDKWNEELRNAKRRLSECRRGKDARERKAAEILTFKDRDLPAIAKKVITDFESGIDWMRKEAKGIKDSLRSYSRNQYAKEECSVILRQIKARYQTINEIAQGLGDPMVEWIRELDHALQSIPLQPFPVTTRTRPSDVDLDLKRVLRPAKAKKQIKAMEEGWPAAWSWEGLKNLGRNVRGDDIRYHWINDLLGITDEDTRAFIEPWDAYCKRVCEIIRDNLAKARSQIKAEHDALLLNPDGAIQEVSREINVLQSLEADRDELIERLNSLWPQEVIRKNTNE